MPNANEPSHTHRETSGFERLVAESVRTMLNGLPINATIEESDHLRDTLSVLEYFIPEVLREIHPEWNDESLDGVYPLVAKKTGEYEIELVGQCILISDQTLVPIHLILRIHRLENTVNWLRCAIGEKGPQGMIRRPYGSADSGSKQLICLKDQAGPIEWVCCVGYGEKS